MIENLDRPTFRGFDPHAPMQIYRRHLPHWRQDGATYFVTFRLGDSIPKQVLLDWQDQDRVWLNTRGIDASSFVGRSSGPSSSGAAQERRPTANHAGPSKPDWQVGYDALPERDRREFERRAARRLHVELDKCQGSCLLRRPEARRVLGDTLDFYSGKRWWVGDFVVMPNHVHGLFQPLPVGQPSGPPAIGGGAGAPPYDDVGRSSGPSAPGDDVGQSFCLRASASIFAKATTDKTAGQAGPSGNRRRGSAALRRSFAPNGTKPAGPSVSEDGAEHRPTCHELSEILGSVKGYVSTRLTKLGLKTGQMWQQENYDRLVRDREELRVWRRYIARNPEKAKLDANSYTHYQCDWLDDPS